jgi:glutamine amidotransferase-like uncharacterized protein
VAIDNIRIGIYTGEGASHSWIWFGEILDRMGFRDVSFLPEESFKQLKPGEFDVLVVSGGDTFRMAEVLGEDGARNLRSFLDGGGTFIGTCAGAYLPLNSSKSPLNLFNFVPVKIANLKDNLPECITPSEKFCTPYGCQYVYHAVRESVKIKGTGEPPFDFSSEIEAPIYGGPSLLPSEAVTALAYYSDFTPQTLFLVTPSIARDTLIGKIAALRMNIGKGMIYLFGPHLEHPYFPEANTLIGKVILGCQKREGDEKREVNDPDPRPLSSESSRILKNLKREVSNGRIRASGLAQKRLGWKIGNKFWEAEKAVYFYETVWKKMAFVEKNIDRGADSKRLILISNLASRCLDTLKDLGGMTQKDGDSFSLAEILFQQLRGLCSETMQLYFNLKLIYGENSES